MDWIEEARRLWGLDTSPVEQLTAPEETTQQKAVRLAQDAREGATPGPVAAEPQEPEETPEPLQDTQAASMPDPASKARLKQKLQVMLQKRV